METTIFFKKISDVQKKELLKYFNFSGSASKEGNYCVVVYEDGLFKGYRIWSSYPKHIVEDSRWIVDSKHYPTEVELIKPYITDITKDNCIGTLAEITMRLSNLIDEGRDAYEMYDFLMKIRDEVKEEWLKTHKI